MKHANILHNPNAGRQEYTEKELSEILESSGFGYRYASTKEKGWKRLHPKTDFLIIAGGDGTIRKVAVKLLDKIKHKKRLPIVLVPAGTANNIAKNLGISGHARDIIGALDKHQIKKYDIGRINGLRGSQLFIESTGFGIFPTLMKQMMNKPEREELSPEEELKSAQRQLLHIIQNFTAMDLEIYADGTDYSGRYLMAEVMNIGSLGPNLVLSPDGDPGDGQFELVLIAEDKRRDLARQVSNMIAGGEHKLEPLIVPCKKVSIGGRSQALHIDDELSEWKKRIKLTIEPDPGMMEFVVLD